MATPVMCYGYVRIEEASDGTMVFSGLIVNNSGATTGLTLTITFTSGGTGSYQTSSFSLPVGDSNAFSLPISESFSGAHKGTLVVQSGSSQVDSCDFSSDMASAGLGFQTVIVGHAMPDVIYPQLPSQVYPMNGTVT